MHALYHLHFVAIYVKSALANTFSVSAAPMAALTQDKAKKLAVSLARQVQAGDTTSPAFQADLANYHAYQTKCRSEGKNLCEGKHHIATLLGFAFNFVGLDNRFRRSKAN